MSAALRKLVDIGAGATIYPGSAGDLRFHDNRALLADTGTGWVRLWADWPSLQPDPALAIDDPANPGFARLQALDEQIRAACDDGLRVVLLAYRFPPWANGTEALAAVRNTDAEAGFQPEDRMSRDGFARYVREGRDPARYNPSRRALELRIPPEGLGPDSAWAAFFGFLVARYHLGQRASGRHVHAFELANEPNYQWWPQRMPSSGPDRFGADGAPIAPAAMAEMMDTAQAVSARVAHSTRLLAPSTADSPPNARLVTGPDDFTFALLDALDLRGHRAHEGMAWAHHNYLDLELRSERTTTQRLRELLRGRWHGHALDGGPAVWITEGGVRLTAMRQRHPSEDVLEAQARSWRLGWERHARPDGAGEGVAMLAQYTLRAEPRFDCGLLDPWPRSRRRPAYAAWRSFPGVP
jgi:hypothetical protein